MHYRRGGRTEPQCSPPRPALKRLIDERSEPLSPDLQRGIVPSTPGLEQHDNRMPRPDDLSEVRSEFVLELCGGLRTRRREVSHGATRPDHRRY